MLSTDVEPLSLCLLRRAAAEQGLRIETALYDARAPASPLPLIGGRATDLLLVSDCFVTPGLAAALGARVAELVEDIDFTMLTTTDSEGNLVSRPMSTRQMDDAGAIWFSVDL